MFKIINLPFKQEFDKDGSLENSSNIPAIATIGCFDGVHLGHIELFKQLNIVSKDIALSSKTKLRRLVITFEPTPHEFFCDKLSQIRTPKIGLLRDKLCVIAQSRLIDEVAIIKFDQQFSDTSATDFVKNYLLNRLNVNTVVIGDDFKFGKNQQGDFSLLERLGIKVVRLNSFLVNNIRVSSSYIRELAQNNKLEDIKKYLGHNLHYTSHVIYGNQIGRKFGVPTINLSLGATIPCIWGIYTAFVYVDGIRYNAVASVGKNPTISNVENYKLEAHLLGVNLDLYGKIATIEILKFMRNELKFDDLDCLFKQIHQDLADARAYFDQLDLN